jgi:hypothetical protein
MLKKQITLVALIAVCLPLYSWCHAAQSTITESEGYACMGDDKSRKQTELDALTDAKRKAIEHVSTYIKSETKVKNFQLEKDLVEAYANAAIKVIQELEKSWYKDSSSGDCFKLKIKAEVIPDDRAIAAVSKAKLIEDPDAPLNLRIWTDKKEYRQTEKIKIYMKGNKPFYARIVYKDAKGNILQLLPNPLRKENYFNGGVIYEVPSGMDRFELEVSQPFGEENIIVYASPSPLGDLAVQDAGGVYQINTEIKDIGVKTRGIQLKKADVGKDPAASEFFEANAVIHTKK